MNKLVDLPYENEESEDLLQYFYTHFYYNYTQYLSFQMSSWASTINNPWSSADILLNPYRLNASDRAEGSWCSLNIKDSYIILKLQHISIKITNYSIGQNNRYKHYLFKHWKVEGSNNGKNWLSLDEQTIQDDDPFLKGGNHKIERKTIIFIFENMFFH